MRDKESTVAAEGFKGQECDRLYVDDFLSIKNENAGSSTHLSVVQQMLFEGAAHGGVFGEFGGGVGVSASEQTPGILELLLIVDGDDVKIAHEADNVRGGRKNLFVFGIEQPGTTGADKRSTVQLRTEKLIGFFIGVQPGSSIK